MNFCQARTPGAVSGHSIDVIDDADVFVELKTARFLAVLDLPVPYDLS